MPDPLELIDDFVTSASGIMLIACLAWVCAKTLGWIRHFTYFLFGAGGEYRRLATLRFKLGAIKALARAAARYERELDRRPRW